MGSGGLFRPSVLAMLSMASGAALPGSGADWNCPALSAWAPLALAVSAAAGSSSVPLKYREISAMASSSGVPLFLKLSRSSTLPLSNPSCENVC